MKRINFFNTQIRGKAQKEQFISTGVNFYSGPKIIPCLDKEYHGTTQGSFPTIVNYYSEIASKVLDKN